jgi:cardiolipin synthase
MILWAKDRVWLTTPYFVPDENLMHALLEAKAKGKDVRIIVPSKTDNPLVQAAAYHYYQQLLKAGIRIYLYKKGFYHAKMILLDNEVAAISSCNLDRRSFRLSFEAGLFVYNKDFNQEVEEIFTQDFKDCELLSPKQIANRSVTQRAGTWLALPLTPWL